MTYRVFVSTYAKYNSGSLKGAWLDLEDYACRGDNPVATCLIFGRNHANYHIKEL